MVQSTMDSVAPVGGLTANLWPVGQLLENQVTTVISVAIKNLTQSWSQPSNAARTSSDPSSSSSANSSSPSNSNSNCNTKDLTANKKLTEYTLSQVAEHISPSDCWIVIYDKVYDVTNFLSQHLGGEFIILEYAGRDATLAFRSTRHGDDSYALLEKYLIGILVEKERMYKNKSHSPSRQG